jgi:hypothetical protein
MTATIKEIKPWGNLKDARETFGICKEALNRLVDAGEVRTKKLGDGNKAQRLYRLADINAYLEGAQ